jgi:hypothetical protein
MCILRIQALCDKRFSEILPDDVEKAELAVEDVMGQVLLDLFGEGMVDEVTIRFPANLRVGLQNCSIQILAQSPCQCFTLFPRTEEHMKMAITRRIGALLRELFVSVDIASVTLSHTPWIYEDGVKLCC